MITQGRSLYAVKAFEFRPQRKNARVVRVALGAEMWVTNTMHNQARDGLVCLAKPRQCQHYNYPFSFEQIAEYFGESVNNA